MVKVAQDVERAELWNMPPRMEAQSGNISEAVAEAACHAASTLKAKAIAVLTQTGGTALRIAKFRPQVPIIAFTPLLDTQRRLSLCWGVKSSPIGSMEGTDQQITSVEETFLSSGLRKGDVVVITMGVPLEARGSTNLMKVHKLGTKGFYEIF